MKLPMGTHICVYLPFVVSKDDERGKMWMAKSYEEAMETLEEFIRSEDFVPSGDASFEIFDDDMEPCLDQDLISDLIAEIEEELERQIDQPSESQTSLAHQLDHQQDVAHDVGDSFVDSREIIIVESGPTKRESKDEVKEVKFSEIKIEDNRK